jgi:hypothetical protein
MYLSNDVKLSHAEKYLPGTGVLLIFMLVGLSILCFICFMLGSGTRFSPLFLHCTGF